MNVHQRGDKINNWNCARGLSTAKNAKSTFQIPNNNLTEIQTETKQKQKQQKEN